MLQEKDVRNAGETDWASVRAGFPVAENYAYLNSAGAGPVSRRVAEAVAQLDREMLESGDRLWDSWIARRGEARAAGARLIKAEADEIRVTSNPSTGVNLLVDALEALGD